MFGLIRVNGCDLKTVWLLLATLQGCLFIVGTATCTRQESSSRRIYENRGNAPCDWTEPMEFTKGYVNVTISAHTGTPFNLFGNQIHSSRSCVIVLCSDSSCSGLEETTRCLTLVKKKAEVAFTLANGGEKLEIRFKGSSCVDDDLTTTKETRNLHTMDPESTAVDSVFLEKKKVTSARPENDYTSPLVRSTLSKNPPTTKEIQSIYTMEAEAEPRVYLIYALAAGVCLMIIAISFSLFYFRKREKNAGMPEQRNPPVCSITSTCQLDEAVCYSQAHSAYVIMAPVVHPENQVNEDFKLKSSTCATAYHKEFKDQYEVMHSSRPTPLCSSKSKNLADERKLVPGTPDAIGKTIPARQNYENVLYPNKSKPCDFHADTNRRDGEMSYNLYRTPPKVTHGNHRPRPVNLVKGYAESVYVDMTPQRANYDRDASYVNFHTGPGGEFRFVENSMYQNI